MNYEMIWNDMKWNEMIWNDVIWCDMMWYNVGYDVIWNIINIYIYMANENNIRHMVYDTFRVNDIWYLIYDKWYIIFNILYMIWYSDYSHPRQGLIHGHWKASSIYRTVAPVRVHQHGASTPTMLKRWSRTSSNLWSRTAFLHHLEWFQYSGW